MTRRGFFGLLAGAITGATLDPERLLWVPGKKLISIPTPQTANWIDYPYPNVILTPALYSRLVLRDLGTDMYPKRIGDTVKIRRPYRFVTA